MIEKNNKEELIKLINENPDLPLVFFASNDDFCPDYGATVFNEYRCYKSTIWINEDDTIYYDDEEEVIEIYKNILCDDERFKDLDNEEFEKAIKDYVEQNVEHYDAIVVSMRT